MYIGKLLFGVITGILLVFSVEIVFTIIFIVYNYLKIQRTKKDGK